MPLRVPCLSIPPPDCDTTRYPAFLSVFSSFLLSTKPGRAQNGYDVRYCTRIAPGETKRTCRQVGAHNKHADRDSKTPVQIEYENTYNRLKKRKARGKISTDEWNALVARAQDIREQAQRGGLSDFEMKKMFEEI